MGKLRVDSVRRSWFAGPLEIVLVYFMVSAIWIAISDNLVFFFIEDPSMRNNVSIVKGMVFILLTSFLLYHLVKKGFDSLRATQDSLRQSERKIRVMIEHAPYGIIECNEQGTIVRANLKANQILGTSANELIGADLDQFVYRAGDIPTASGGSSQPGDMNPDQVQRLVRKNDDLIWVQRVSTHFSNEGGSDGYVLEMIQDVTAQKESSIQLARRADELEVLYDVSRKIIGSELASESLDGICSVAVDRLKASFASVHLFSVTGQMTAIAQKGIIPDVTAELENLRTVSDEGVELVQRPNGVWAIMPLMEGGEAIGAMVIGHTEHDWFTKERLAPFQSLSNLALLAIQKIRMIDALRLYANNLEDKVTERTKDLTETTLHLAEEVKRTKEAQERLFQEKERLDVTLHSIGEGVIVTDIIGTILLANRTAQETGANDDVPITGRQITDVLPIRDPVTEEPVKDHWISRGQDGSGSTEQKGVIIDLRGRRDLSYNSAPVRDRDGEAVGFVIVFRDITDDVKLQKAASEAQRLESIGQLAGGIAHSFNNILTSILGNIEMLNFDGLEESKKATCLDDARLSAMKAKDLSNQLLTFAKGGEPIRKNVSVIDLLNRTKEKLSNRSKINLQVSSESERYLVNADEVQMGQAFSNLMVNALASAPKGIILDVSVSYQDMDNDNAVSKTPSRYVVINMEAPNWISNRRAGFDLEPQNSTLDEKQGLDLAIANSIIRRHDGFMLMDSSAKGSNYKVYLPAWSECVSTPSARSKPRLDRPAKILVMDDDEGVLEVLTGMIEVLGHQVIAAKEGGEAIELFAQAETAGEPFDVVIMDLNIPGGLGGRETIRRLQERYTKVNVIVSSGYSNDPITANYISYGFKGVLPKPYTMKQLEEVIKKAMLDS